MGKKTVGRHLGTAEERQIRGVVYTSNNVFKIELCGKIVVEHPDWFLAKVNLMHKMINNRGNNSAVRMPP